MMTKENFEAIANIINAEVAVRPKKPNPEGITLYCLTCSLADYFNRNNPRFNRALFMRACGFPSM